MFGLLFFCSLKGFCCYCFKWQQTCGERDGGSGGVVTVKKHLSRPFSTLAMRHTACTFPKVSKGTRNRWCIRWCSPSSSTFSPPSLSICLNGGHTNKGGTRHKRSEASRFSLSRRDKTPPKCWTLNQARGQLGSRRTNSQCAFDLFWIFFFFWCF